MLPLLIPQVLVAISTAWSVHFIRQARCELQMCAASSWPANAADFGSGEATHYLVVSGMIWPTRSLPASLAELPAKHLCQFLFVQVCGRLKE
jgi:hypothetical protein